MADALDADQLVLERLRDRRLDDLGRGARVAPSSPRRSAGRRRGTRGSGGGSARSPPNSTMTSDITVARTGRSMQICESFTDRRRPRRAASGRLGDARRRCRARPCACRRTRRGRPRRGRVVTSTRPSRRMPSSTGDALGRAVRVDPPDERPVGVVDDRRLGHDERVLAPRRSRRRMLAKSPAQSRRSGFGTAAFRSEAAVPRVERRRDEVDLAREGLVREGRDRDRERHVAAAPTDDRDLGQREHEARASATASMLSRARCRSRDAIARATPGARRATPSNGARIVVRSSSTAATSTRARAASRFGGRAVELGGGQTFSPASACARR